MCNLHNNDEDRGSTSHSRWFICHCNLVYVVDFYIQYSHAHLRMGYVCMQPSTISSKVTQAAGCYG